MSFFNAGKILLALSVMLPAVLPSFAEEGSREYLSDKYPGLSSGILSRAILAELPDEELVKVKEKPITRDMLDIKIMELPEERREQGENYEFYILEGMVTKPIMMAIILDIEDLPADNDLFQKQIREYLESVMNTVEISDKEIRRFYDENPDMFSDDAFDDVKEMLQTELTRQKQREAWDEHVRNMGNEVEIRVNRAWVEEQVEKVKDNPLDKARVSDKPVLAVFVAEWSPPCQKLKPVIEKLAEELSDKAAVLMFDTDEQGFLASRYNIVNIPTLLFFDKTGHEVERRSGFLSQEKILNKLEALLTS